MKNQEKIMVNNAIITLRSLGKSKNKEDFKWKRCDSCNSLFISARKTAKYCSDNCRTQNHLKWKKFFKGN